MSTLEDQLREALTERAALSPIDPDTWDKAVRRSRRRLRVSQPGWLPAGFVIPATAAVAVVVVVLGALTLASGRHDIRPGSSGPSSVAASTLPAAPARVFFVHPAVTAIIAAELGGTEVYAWFTDPEDGYGCAVALSTPTSSGGYWCGRWPSGPSWPGPLVGADSIINIGRADRQVTSVTTFLSDGSSVPGVIFSGRGFPFKVWLVSVPSGDGALLTFRDAAGHVVVWLTDYGQFVPRIPHGGIIVDGWTAFLIGGRVLWRAPNYGVFAPLPWTVKQEPLLVLFPATTKVSYAVGYTPADVSRLELRFPDGATYAGPTVPAWPASGVRLWVRSGLPKSGLPPTTAVISYNTAGMVIGEQTLASLGGG
jgi:hypothetical protein